MEVRQIGHGNSCHVCLGVGEVCEVYDDVQVYSPCECRGGRPAGPKPAPIGFVIADPDRMRELFEALVAKPDDRRLYAIRQQIARAMGTAADHPYLGGFPRLVDSGMILDDLHRSDLLSNFWKARPELTIRSDRMGEVARALDSLCEIVRHAPLRVRLSDA